MAPRVRLRVQPSIVVGATLVLIALNFRLTLAAVPPVLDDIRAATGLSTTAAGLLTTAPVLCFGLAAPLAPFMTRRLGQEALLLVCMLVLAAGAALRLIVGVAPLFAGTIVLGIAIAVANVVMPSVIKRRFARPGPMMGLYTMSLSSSAAIAAGLTVPLESVFGSWRWAVAVWGIPAVVAALAWLPETSSTGSAPSEGTEHALSLWRDRTAWLVTAAFGLQSLLFYSMLAWVPEILRAGGMSSGSAGAMLSIAMLCGLPGAMIVPVLAARARDQRVLAVIGPSFWMVGLLGLLLFPTTAPAVWMVLLGLGQGSGIALALTLVVLRSPDGAHAGALSGMAQGVGYLLAAAGPLALGALHDATGSWDAPLILLVAVTASLVAFGVGAGRATMVRGRAPRDRRPVATGTPA